MTMINTSRFGEVEIAEDRVIRFAAPILGFEDSHRYVLLDHAEDSPFKWLQSADDPELAFVVTSPKLFGIEYEFVISDETAGQLSLTTAEDALVLTIVNIPQEDPGKMTANLLGPVVINQNIRIAMQVVLNDTNYSTKTRLIPDDVLHQSAKSPSGSGVSADKGD
jgi:flagellar assembly factor FliW